MSKTYKSNYQKFISTQPEKQVVYNNYNNYNLANSYIIKENKENRENYDTEPIVPLCPKKNYLGLTYQGVT